MPTPPTLDACREHDVSMLNPSLNSEGSVASDPNEARDPTVGRLDLPLRHWGAQGHRHVALGDGRGTWNRCCIRRRSGRMEHRRTPGSPT